MLPFILLRSSLHHQPACPFILLRSSLPLKITSPRVLSLITPTVVATFFVASLIFFSFNFATLQCYSVAVIGFLMVQKPSWFQLEMASTIGCLRNPELPWLSWWPLACRGGRPIALLGTRLEGPLQCCPPCTLAGTLEGPLSSLIEGWLAGLRLPPNEPTGDLAHSHGPKIGPPLWPPLYWKASNPPLGAFYAPFLGAGQQRQALEDCSGLTNLPQLTCLWKISFSVECMLKISSNIGECLLMNIFDAMEVNTRKSVSLW